MKQMLFLFALFICVSSLCAAADHSNPTQIEVRVIAKDGKFLGDDIGGALITIRDAQTNELLATGKTSGGSGVPALMTTAFKRDDPLPIEDANVFTATLNLEEPRQIEVTAFGPLGVEGSANRASATQWVFPGKDLTGGDGFLLELRGLVVEVLSPPSHFLPKTTPPATIHLRANVTMMCGCPIGPGLAWLPENYEVTAIVTLPDGSHDQVQLTFDKSAPDHAPSQFTADYVATKSGVYQAVVYAYQKSNGNTGVDRTSFIIP